MYEPSICRSIKTSYQYETTYNGIPVLMYHTDFADDANVKQCFCRDIGNADSCPPMGTIDLFHCSGVPMISSLPHFYLADPKLLDGIASGLNPSKEKHGVELFFEVVSYFFVSFFFLFNFVFFFLFWFKILFCVIFWYNCSQIRSHLVVHLRKFHFIQTRF